MPQQVDEPEQPAAIQPNMEEDDPHPQQLSSSSSSGDEDEDDDSSVELDQSISNEMMEMETEEPPSNGWAFVSNF